MTSGLIGEKMGMMRIFNDAGQVVPVTVIKVLPNYVTQVKTDDVDDYSAVQLSSGKINRISRPRSGHLKKAAVEACRYSKEFRLSADQVEKLELGAELGVSLFEGVEYVDVTTYRSKGHGMQGCIKRWNFSGQNKTHGNSLSHRAPGSIGQCQDPGRVFKGKKMAGHHGAKRVTMQNLQLVKVDNELSVLLVKGAVPGPKKGMVVIKRAKKKCEV